MTPEGIPVMKPRAVESRFLLPRLENIAEAGVFSNRGPQVRELESRLAEWLELDPRLVVATANATVGLSAAVALSTADSWEVPGWSFPASALAPLLIGRKVTFADINPDTWLVKDERGDESTGLMVVIPFGGSFGQEAWSYPGEVIIDAAASLASKPAGLAALPDSACVVFSLHATKTMGGGEGGLIVFGSEERAKRARSWINFGFSGSRETHLIGTNGKMSEYDAAVANARLDGWAEEEKEWATLRRKVRQASRSLGLNATPSAMSSVNPYWIEVFETEAQRNQVISSMQGLGIETRLWWSEGLHRMPAFSSLPSRQLETINGVGRRYLGLPLHLYLSDENISRIIETMSISLGSIPST